jgi:hypothetical protein
VSVEAVGVPVLTPKIDICNARLKFASGCIANITASRISRDKVRKVRFFQPEMYVSVDYALAGTRGLAASRRAGERPAIEGGPVAGVQGRAAQARAGGLRRRRPPARAPGVTGDDGLRALTLATRVADAVGG